MFTRYDMKKGFTIVELIAVIVLLSMITLFIYPVVNKTLKNRKEELYQIQIKNIKDAALSYTNKYNLLKDESVIVTVCQLKQNGFLEEDIKDPRDKSYISDDSKVTIIPSLEGNEFVFTRGENKSNYCVAGSTTLFEYVEVGSKYTETIENISNYQIYVNNSLEAYIGDDYVNTNKIGTYFIEYKSSIKTIQKYVYVIDTKLPEIVYKNEVNGSTQIGDSLIIIEASDRYFEPYEAVAYDNSLENIKVKITSNVNMKLPGTYYITYSASDSSGNKVSKTQNIKIVDTKGPIVNVNGISEEMTQNSVYISVDAVDEGSGLNPTGAYSFDGGKTWQVTNVFTVDENQSVKIVVRDLVGNKTNKTVVIDNILKNDNDISFSVVNGVMKSNGWYVTNVDVKIKPLINEEYFSSFTYCKTTNESCEPNVTQTNYDGTVVDVYENTLNTTLCAYVTQKDGTRSSTQCSFNIKIDKTYPIITLSANKQNSGRNINSGVWSDENIVLNPNINPSNTISGYTYEWYYGNSLVANTLDYVANQTGVYRFVVTTGAGFKNEYIYVANIDKTAPTCSFNVQGTVGNNNWYISKNVVVDGEFYDSGGSEIVSKDISTSNSFSSSGRIKYTISQNTMGINLYCYIEDGAGNTGQNSITIKKDDGSATCYSEGENTVWTNSKPYVTYNARPISGCVNGVCTSEITKNIDVVTKTKTSSATWRALSGAAVVCPSKTFNIYYDAEAPKCTYSDNFSSPSNKDVTLTIGCNDGSGSGCKTGFNGVSTLLTATSSGALNTTIFDNAGNSTTCSKGYDVIIDTMPPVCRINVTSIGANGVSGTISVSDVDSNGVTCATCGSGVATSTSITFTNLKKTTDYTMKDNAGNASTCRVNIDSKVQKRTATCRYYASCANSACGNKTCTNGAYCGYTTTYSCPSGFTLRGSKCYWSGSDHFSPGVIDAKANSEAKTCSDSRCGYLTCQTSGCGCGSWNSFGAWTDVDTCTARTGNSSKTECQTYYFNKS